MDYFESADKHYWEEILIKMNREDENSARRYRRYNKSLDAMGEKTVLKERAHFCEDEFRAFEALMNFADVIENEKLLKAIKALKPIELQILIYRFEHKMQVGEIAKVLGKGISTVSERLGRILCKLIVELEK